MKLLATVAFLALTSACNTTSHTRDIEGICHAQQAAWNRGDVAAFMAEGYWKASELTFFSGGEVTRGFEPVLARYVKRYKSEDSEMGQLAFTNIEVLTLSDDAAIARGRWDLDFDKQPDVGGLFTLVFEKKHEGWRIVHDHTSVDSAKKTEDSPTIRKLGYVKGH